MQGDLLLLLEEVSAKLTDALSEMFRTYLDVSQPIWLAVPAGLSFLPVSGFRTADGTPWGNVFELRLLPTLRFLARESNDVVVLQPSFAGVGVTEGLCFVSDEVKAIGRGEEAFLATLK